MAIDFLPPVVIPEERVASDMTSETFWPSLKASIDRGEVEFKDLTLKCEICGPDKTTDSDDEDTYDPTITIFPCEHIKDTDGKQHSGAMLPCGHIFGASCIQSWFDHNRHSEVIPSCPKCRQEFQHSICRHGYYDTMSLPSTKFGIGGIPPTLGEGGFIPAFCHLCRIGEVLRDFGDAISSYESMDRVGGPRVGVSVTTGGIRYHGMMGIVSMDVEAPESFWQYTEKRKRALEAEDNNPERWVAGFLDDLEIGVHLYYKN